MALTLRYVGSQCLRRQSSGLFLRRVNMSQRVTPYEEMGRYWAKNRQLNRPLSPHLTVFKPNLTMVISITNRIAAVALQAGLCVASITLMCLPGDYKTYLDKIRSLKLGPAFVYSIKFIIAFPFAYHLVAGLRHLLWDMGYGFSKPVAHSASWAVLALTAVSTGLLVFGFKPSSL